MSEQKYKNKYQSIFDKFKDYHTTDGYSLECIDEIYLPFWFCKQGIIVEKDIEVDKFSRIILELVDSSIKTHPEICQFLGIDENNFVIMQFHFLIKNGLLEENSLDDNQTLYELTHEGRRFLEEKGVLQKTEIIEFEYMVNDLGMELLEKTDYQYFFNDLKQDFFNEKNLVDDVSKEKNKNFKGYKVIPTINITKNNKNRLPKNHIPHKNKPTINDFKSADFSNFFNKNYQEGTFYDYEDGKINAHKRSILFLLLIYESDTGQSKIEIRQSKNSVRKFRGYELENELSSEAKRYFDNDNEFIGKLRKC